MARQDDWLSAYWVGFVSVRSESRTISWRSPTVPASWTGSNWARICQSGSSADPRCNLFATSWSWSTAWSGCTNCTKQLATHLSSTPTQSASVSFRESRDTASWSSSPTSFASCVRVGAPGSRCRGLGIGSAGTGWRSKLQLRSTLRRWSFWCAPGHCVQFEHLRSRYSKMDSARVCRCRTFALAYHTASLWSSGVTLIWGHRRAPQTQQTSLRADLTTCYCCSYDGVRMRLGQWCLCSRSMTQKYLFMCWHTQKRVSAPGNCRKAIFGRRWSRWAVLRACGSKLSCFC